MRLWNSKPIVMTALLVIVALGTVAAQRAAQTAEIPRRTEPFFWTSGRFDGIGDAVEPPGLVREDVVSFPGVPWMQLRFDRAHLGDQSYLEITSLADGATQRLDAKSLATWNNHSAFFNGDAVEVRLFVAPLDRGISIDVAEIVVGEWGGPANKSICGSDNRVTSNEPRVARIDPIGCTGWIIDSGQHLSAGHCLAGGSSNQTLSFNVPPSLSNGTVQFPGPEDQYSIDQSSFDFVNGGVGNDWGVFAVFDNSQTGLQPIQAQGSFTVKQDLGPANIRITGFGVDSGTTNQTNQTHVGPNAGSSGTTMRYVTDTQGGNSGSPVIDEATGQTVGIHTHGGCTSSGGNNNGTSFFNSALWNALDTAPPPPPPTCSNQLYGADFEGGGADGWTNDSASTCSTGDFLAATPTQVVNGGVTTQVGGAADGSGAWFTATNSSAGVNDVDGGTCDTRSPTVTVGAGDVTINFDYFHGQRDAGDDSGDGFVIDVLNGSGAVIDTIVGIGDVTSNAAWTAGTTSFSVGSDTDVRLRVRATDAAGPGDLVEGGIDNVQICGNDPGGPPPGGCTVDDDFEGGAPDWFNDGASTCTTGDYVLGNPTQQTNGGVTTQVGGSNSGTSSIFTATNTSAGVNDVDGGNCILGSPTWSVSAASTLSVAYWHGQRDAGDDPGDDFFFLEYSTNGGSSWNTLVSNGDSTSNASWDTATAQIPAGSTVAVRVQCSDGAGPGDLVECGIDDVSICDN